MRVEAKADLTSTRSKIASLITLAGRKLDQGANSVSDEATIFGMCNKLFTGS